MKILIIDDCVPILEVVELILRGPGIEIYTTTESMEALSIMKKVSFDLVITDVNMPLKNGIDLSYDIRENFPDVFIILYSAQFNGLEKYREDVRKIGNATFIEDKSISKLLDVFTDFKKKVIY